MVHRTSDIPAQAQLISLDIVIQNVADPQRNDRIGKVFELAESRFRAIWNSISTFE